MKHFLLLVLACFTVLLSFSQSGKAVLNITNEDNKTLSLSADEITAMPHITLDIKAHDGNMHSYSGVLLLSILKQAGVRLGDSAKKSVSGSYVVVTAADKYKAVYALSEIDTLQSTKTVILADKVDRKPLPQNALPYQIIATGEKIHARMIRQVVAIDIKKAM